MDALPFIPSWAEWWLAIGIFTAGFLFFLASSGARRPANPHRGGRPGQESPVPEGATEAGTQVGLENVGTSTPPRIQRRQSRNRIKRVSIQTKQENDARLRLHRAGLLVMAGKHGKRP